MSDEYIGVVTKSTGSWYSVRTANTKIWKCRIRGKIRLKGERFTNPVAVGDRVKFSPEEGDERLGVIGEILDRKNHIIRKSVNLSKESQIIAANIDCLYLIVTLKEPKTLKAFIDRYLVSAAFYHIPTNILVNKIDLLNTPDLQRDLADFLEIYREIGYVVKTITGLRSEEVATLKNEIRDKVVMFGGHSGVGKSTIINQLDENLDIRTGKVSDYHKTGQHTTTFAEMHMLESGGYIIDTPGIRSFGLIDYEKQNLSHYFPEMQQRLVNCKFHNCQHLNEPKCAIKEAYENGEISVSRYHNYVAMMEEEEGELYRKSIYK